VNNSTTEQVLATMKTEANLQSRQLQTTLNQLAESLGILQHEMAKHHQQFAQQLKIESDMILDFLEIYDRLYAGYAIMKQYQPAATLFSFSNEQDIGFITSLMQGQAMTLNRFEQVLQRHQVTPIETIGKILDPLIMTAVATVSRKDQKHGVVVEELRKGFLIQNRVLRLAEVKVNKRPDGGSDEI
jgi:molecular chaperone GrpE